MTLEEKYDKVMKCLRRSLPTLREEIRRSDELGMINPQQIRYVMLDLADVFKMVEGTKTTDPSEGE
jgi:hypothetical protein